LPLQAGNWVECNRIPVINDNWPVGEGPSGWFMEARHEQILAFPGGQSELRVAEHAEEFGGGVPAREWPDTAGLPRGPDPGDRSGGKQDCR